MDLNQSLIFIRHKKWMKKIKNSQLDTLKILKFLLHLAKKRKINLKSWQKIANKKNLNLFIQVNISNKSRKDSKIKHSEGHKYGTHGNRNSRVKSHVKTNTINAESNKIQTKSNTIHTETNTIPTEISTKCDGKSKICHAKSI